MDTPDVVILPVVTDAPASGDSPGNGSSNGASSSNGSSNGDPSNGDSSNGTSGGSGSSSSSGDSSSQDAGGDDQEQKKNGLEWVVFAIGLAIVGGVVGFLTYQLITQTNEPPLLVIELGEQTPREKVVEIEVTVKNEGDVVAESATIEVCGGPDTCAELTFPYVPAGSKRTGRVGLNTPLAGPLETRAVSFQL